MKRSLLVTALVALALSACAKKEEAASAVSPAASPASVAEASKPAAAADATPAVAPTSGNAAGPAGLTPPAPQEQKPQDQK